MEILGIIYALFAALFIALFQISAKKSYEELPPSVAFFFDAMFGLLIWVPLAIFMGISADVSWSEAFTFAVISAILSEVIFFYALSHGELAVTATVLATYPVYTVIFSILLNNEKLTPFLVGFVILAILGSVLASLPNKLSREELKFNKALVWPFIAAVCIGLSDTISKGYINRSEDFSFLFSLGIVQVPVALAYLRVEKQSLTKSLTGVVNNLGKYKLSLIGGLFNIIGTGFLWLSFYYAPASIASPMTGFSGALTVLLSRAVLKEKVSSVRYLGIVVAFVGVLGIAVLRSN